MYKNNQLRAAQEISNIIYEKFEKQYLLYTIHDKAIYNCLAIKYNSEVLSHSYMLLTIIQQVISELEISYGVYEYKKFMNLIHHLLNLTKDNAVEKLENESFIYFPNIPPPVDYNSNEF